MSELDVTLSKGAPDRVLDKESDEGRYRKIFLYHGGLDSYTYTILRGNKGSLVVTDICGKGGYSKVLGFGEYSSEASLRKKLGEPSGTSVNDDGTAKIISFAKWNAAYEIEKGQVVKACVTKRTRMRYSTEYENASEWEQNGPDQ